MAISSNNLVNPGVLDECDPHIGKMVLSSPLLTLDLEGQRHAEVVLSVVFEVCFRVWPGSSLFLNDCGGILVGMTSNSWFEGHEKTCPCKRKSVPLVEVVECSYFLWPDL